MLSGGDDTVKGGASTEEPRYRIQLVEKIFAILEAFDSDHSELTLTEISALSGQSRTGVYRILANLVRMGAVVRDPVTKRYRIGAHLYAIGSLAVRDVRRVAIPLMEALQRRTGWVVNLSIRDDLAVVIVEVLESDRVFRMAASVGAREPLHATASGKCFLAFERPDIGDDLMSRMTLTRFTDRTLVDPAALRVELDRTAARGYGLDEGEYDTLYRCVAVPLYDHRSQICASLSVSGSSDMLDHGHLQALVADIVETGQHLSEDLGFKRTFERS